jgi:aminoglycoside-2''-adenylyltransferase
MDKRNEGQWRVIRKVLAVAQAADIPVWLFGGWGLDARIGRITREHGDVEFWVERIHAERSKAMLVEAGAAALTTQPPEEACEFSWDDVPFSTAYFDRQSEILRGLVTGPGAGLTPGPFPAEDERKSLSQNERESRQ